MATQQPSFEENVPSPEPDRRIFRPEDMHEGDVLQARGETEPFKFLGTFRDKLGNLLIHVESIVSREERFIAQEDIIGVDRGAKATDNEHYIAGNILAQDENDNIEKWKLKN